MSIYAPMRDVQQDKPVAYCAKCQGEMYRHDEMFLWEGKKLCAACIKEKFDAMSIPEIAELLGAERVGVVV